MAFWQPGQALYLPPTPVTKVLCSEQYINVRDIFYHGETERMLTSGSILSLEVTQKHTTVPKVSPNQYRVFRVALPDPNQFALPDKALHNPSKERLVWAVVGVQVSRGQPLGGEVRGHSYFNTFLDAENVSKKVTAQGTDDRKQAGMDTKQQQVLMLGCTPAIGEYWTKARPCVTDRPDAGSCPPIELKLSFIEDGDMMDIGFGAANFKELNATKSDLPLDIANSICLYPDYLKMTEEAAGNSMFFFARKEQVYVRHIWTPWGTDKELPPEAYYLKPPGEMELKMPSVFFASPSGSLVSTDGQLFNRPYWILRAQGMNNGVCWNNTLFVTVGDNTRGSTLTITVPNNDEPLTEYDTSKFNVYQRHVEEFKLAFILELCSVELTPETVSSLQGSMPSILENWEINLQPPTSSVLEDIYRFIDSPATKCADNVSPSKPEDPYSAHKFWEVNLKEKLSLDLDQFPLGRLVLQFDCRLDRLLPQKDHFTYPEKRYKRHMRITGTVRKVLLYICFSLNS
ncbi:major capsid protein [Odocoileus virginianus papillomavirus 1]|uniref:Major capsid protein L1 n=1 Tax=Odocoileus virginianus papillomavirus 1 TaxID=2772504 RepID=VL1_OVPVD|nr:major capsid protein [Deltapapillomavirus 2]P03104.1 RecName: Full=Major capsid protein L1 [Odocoileus virginianus papillomavirus 1]AAA66848.1 major capsid protein [Odocoileus virginianus papillomavirus 1]